MYSTCTINSAENEEMVRFISEELKFQPVSLEGVLPEALIQDKRNVADAIVSSGKDTTRGLTEAQQNASIQLMPGYMEADGFFLAKFRKN